MTALIVIPDVVQHLHNCYHLSDDDDVILKLINDDSVCAVVVYSALINILNLSPQVAMTIVLEAHTLGTSTVGKYPEQEAIKYQVQLRLLGITTEIE